MIAQSLHGLHAVRSPIEAKPAYNRDVGFNQSETAAERGKAAAPVRRSRARVSARRGRRRCALFSFAGNIFLMKA